MRIVKKQIFLCGHRNLILHWFLSLLLASVFPNLCVSGEILRLPLKNIQRNEQPEQEIRIKRDVSLEYQQKNLKGKPGQGYYIETNIGSPPQKINVLIDTGSSNFAVASSPNTDITTYFHKLNSTSYKETATEVYVPYTQGNWQGILGTDLVTLTSLPNITVRSNIAFITESSNFFINGSNWQGILGLAYKEISRPDSSVVPFFDSLVQTSGIANIFSIQLCGMIYNVNSERSKEMGGSITFGGVDSALHTGSVFYTPIHKEWYYEIIVVDVQVGGQSLKMDCKEYNFAKTIVDSGTTNLRLPVRVFDAVLQRIKSFVKLHGLFLSDDFWLGTKTSCWPENKVPYSSFPTVSLSFVESSNWSFNLVISPQQYIRPVGEENDDSPDNDCFKIGIASSTAGTVIGGVAMEGFYVIFDRKNKRIGFAETTCPARDPGSVLSSIQGPLKYTGNSSDCAYIKVEDDNKKLTVVAYIMAAICGVCVLPLIILLIQYQWRTSKCGSKLQRHDSTLDSNDLIGDPER